MKISEQNRTDQEKMAYGETCQYIHDNFLISSITNLGYKKCSKFIKSKEKVVEIGCGTGDFIPYCPCKKYMGVDITEDFIITSKEKFPEHEFVVGDAYDLPFENNSISSLLSFSTLEHLDKLDLALEQVNRVLTDDGEFIFGIPTEGFLYRIGRNLTTKRHVEKTTNVNYDELLKKEHVNACKDILDAVKSHFVVDKLQGIPFYYPSINFNVFIVGRCLKKS